MSAIRYDLRQAVRTLARMPGTTLLSVVTLGLGIAAATTTFSAVYAAIFRPIPFQDPDRLLYLHTTSGAGPCRRRRSAGSCGGRAGEPDPGTGSAGRWRHRRPRTWWLPRQSQGPA